ncbi:hypothetical protein DLAC_05311 [Tieghemostelium lacteum]|uniref:TORTIFOLIA1/SINE1-2 N-terminal domain-containing protein n=1 Tax=Tieghemostelium lacteum TaxID=361077 RepID=A0A151ZJ16_TIELA|nr:hypothetical protein DLAC_05311 [Tieghemostelium lacteum]|eukprot:KYQ93907.1 hypothetical protein DLAC_05311 [Tieghemostelium lacteum]
MQKSTRQQLRTNPLNEMFEWRNQIKISFEKLCDAHYSKSAEQDLITAIEYLNNDTLSFFMTCLLDINNKNELEKKEIMKLTGIIVTIQGERIYAYQNRILKVMLERLSKIEVSCSDCCTDTFGIIVKALDQLDNHQFSLWDYLGPCIQLLGDRNKNIQISSSNAIQRILENVNNISSLEGHSWNLALNLLKILNGQSNLPKCQCQQNILSILSTLIKVTGPYLSNRVNLLLPPILNLLTSFETSLRLASSKTLEVLFLNFPTHSYQSQYDQILKTLEDTKNDRITNVKDSITQTLYIFKSDIKINQLDNDNNLKNQSSKFYQSIIPNQIPIVEQQQNLYIPPPKISATHLLSPTKKSQPNLLYNSSLTSITTNSPFFSSLYNNPQLKTPLHYNSSIRSNIQPNNSNKNDILDNNHLSSPIYSNSQMYKTPNSPILNNHNNSKQKYNNSNNNGKTNLTTLDLNSNIDNHQNEVIAEDQAEDQDLSSSNTSPPTPKTPSNETITTTTTTSYSTSETKILNEILSTLTQFMQQTNESLDNLKSRMEVLETSVCTLQNFHILNLNNNNNNKEEDYLG